MSTDTEIGTPLRAIAEKTNALHGPGSRRPSGMLQRLGPLRKFDRIDPSFRDRTRGMRMDRAALS